MFIPKKNGIAVVHYDPQKIHDPIVPYPVYPHLQQWLIASPIPYWWIPTTPNHGPVQGPAAVVRCASSSRSSWRPDQPSNLGSGSGGMLEMLTPGGWIANTHMYILSIYLCIYNYIYVEREREKPPKGWKANSYLNRSQLDLLYLLGVAFWGLGISETLMAMLGIYAVSEFLRSDVVASSHETADANCVQNTDLEPREHPRIRNYETLGDQLNWASDSSGSHEPKRWA